MISSKSEQLYKDLVNFLNSTSSNTIKRKVRNSVHNNRVPTVNQVVTFLSKSKNYKHKFLGRRLKKAYSISDIRKVMKYLRKGRTDAYDINEFKVSYLIALTGGQSVRKSIGHKIG